MGSRKGEVRSVFRSQVYVQRLRLVPVRGNLQNCGAAEAAMRDQHFLAKLLTVAGGGDLGGNSGEIAIAGAVFLLQDEWHKAWTRDLNLEAELPGEVVAE